MKTLNRLRNLALTLMLVVSTSFSFSQGDGKTSDNLNREKAEFANAGFWIDAVVVNAVTGKSDRELLADKGYFIEPVVVTYRHTAPDQFDTRDGSVFYTMEKESEDLEISMLNDGQTR